MDHPKWQRLIPGDEVACSANLQGKLVCLGYFHSKKDPLYWPLKIYMQLRNRRTFFSDEDFETLIYFFKYPFFITRFSIKGSALRIELVSIDSQHSNNAIWFTCSCQTGDTCIYFFDTILSSLYLINGKALSHCLKARH